MPTPSVAKIALISQPPAPPHHHHRPRHCHHSRQLDRPSPSLTRRFVIHTGMQSLGVALRSCAERARTLMSCARCIPSTELHYDDLFRVPHRALARRRAHGLFALMSSLPERIPEPRPFVHDITRARLPSSWRASNHEQARTRMAAGQRRYNPAVAGPLRASRPRSPRRTFAVAVRCGLRGTPGSGRRIGEPWPPHQRLRACSRIQQNDAVTSPSHATATPARPLWTA